MSAPSCLVSTDRFPRRAASGFALVVPLSLLAACARREAPRPQADRPTPSLDVAALRAAAPDASAPDAAVSVVDAGDPPLTASWSGVLLRTRNSALRAGSTCRLLGVFEGRTPAQARARRLAVFCGEPSLLLANVGAEDAPLVPVSLRKSRPELDTSVRYSLRVPPVATGGGPELEVSSLERRLWLRGRSPTDLDVEVLLDDLSDRTHDHALGDDTAVRARDFGELLTYTGRVVRTTGAAPAARGAECTLRGRGVWEAAQNCRLLVRCGAQVLFGDRASGYVGCAQTNDHLESVDDGLADGGVGPRVRWTVQSYNGGLLELSDRGPRGAWSATLELAFMNPR